jgi:hypothetical protein
MKRTSALFTLLLTLTIPASADQQMVYPPSAMPRVDMHTHMDARTQYAKAVEAMDQWGGTISISLAGLFWVKDNNGSNASPASVRQRERFGEQGFVQRPRVAEGLCEAHLLGD